MEEWSTLTGRWGKTVKNPANADLYEALDDLFAAHADDEHPDAWLNSGSENGPLYSVSIFSSGYAIFTKYSDADMREELESKEIPNIDRESGFKLWKNLIDKNYNGI